MTALPPTLVFDLDGTLVHTAADLVAALNAVLVTQKMAPVSMEAATAMVGSGGRALLRGAFAAEGREVSPDRLEALFADYLAFYDDHLADASRPFPGAVAALDRFAGDGWLLAICTNKYEASARKLMKLIGLDERFAAIAGQNTFAFCKPDGRHITETVRMAGGDPGDAIMVGDSITDVSAAKAAGVPVIAVDYGYSAVPVAELGATRVISRLDQLHDAVADIRRP
jgi:phosphoglycolate phosphatase